MQGKIVVVQTGDISYTGKLVKIDEHEVHLESESGWIVIPTDRVASIREKND